jgi:hypothetical protein
MKRLLPVAAIALVALNLAACDKPRTNSAYNNSGTSATPLLPADPPSQAVTAAPDAAATAASPAETTVTTAPAMSDTASPSTAPMPSAPGKTDAQPAAGAQPK